MTAGPSMRVEIGECLALLRELPDCSIDAVVTDPPAGIEFMDEEWDRFEEADDQPSGPQTDTWSDRGDIPHARGATPRYQGKTKASLLPFQDSLAEVFTEVERVLKPGGHAFVWGLPRTAHHTAMALERAGLELRDVVTHLFGSGFPKNHNIARALDRHAGLIYTPAEHDMEGNETRPAEGYDGYADAKAKPRVRAARLEHGATRGGDGHEGYERPWMAEPDAVRRQALDYVPGSPAGIEWADWGTALKPAVEYWHLVRKDLDGTIANTVLTSGTGGLHVGACRVPLPDDDADTLGRWPPNLILSHSIACNGHCAPDCPVGGLDTQAGSRRSGAPGVHRSGINTSAAFGTENRKPGTPMSGYGDSGGPSRFFPVFEPDYWPFLYQAKPGRYERDAGLDVDEFDLRPLLWSGGEQSPGTFQSPGTVRAARNNHPTVKSTDLMRWLVRLVCPRDGTVLDPYMGSGSTGVACMIEGVHFVGMERKADYARIAEARIRYARANRNAILAGKRRLGAPPAKRKLDEAQARLL